MKKKIIRLILGLGFILLLWGLDLEAIYKNIGLVARGHFFLALFFQGVTIGLLALQWSLVGRSLGLGFNYRDFLSINLAGNIVDAITPGVKVGGELMRVRSIEKKLGLARKDSIHIVGMQKTISLLSFLFLLGLSLVYGYFKRRESLGIYLRSGLYGLLILLAIFGLGLLLIRRPGCLDFLEGLGLKTKLVRRIRQALEDYYLKLRSLGKNRLSLIFQLGLGLLIWLVYPFKLYIIARGFDLRLGILELGLVTYISYIVAMLPLLPGSIGSFELSMASSLSLLGLDFKLGLSMALVFRFVSFWFEFIVSLAYLGLEKLVDYKRRKDYGEIKI